MLHPKDYLLQECENVRSLLRNTLRYAYSSKSSELVYAECNARLEVIESRLRSKAIKRDEQFQELHDQLTSVGRLIGRVERSHIEEFAWPFAQALQDLATGICGFPEQDQYSDDCSDAAEREKEGKELDRNGAPLFFISADDELSSYSIITEQSEAGLIAQPLFNIIFPRSLKHYVLLHPILGHEVGHAALMIHTAALDKDVLRTLTAGSPLDDRNELDKWIKKSGQQLDSELVDEAVMLWPEELYCDLFGLLLMGPSFIGATCSLLQPFDVRGVSDSHPPSWTRYVMLQEAVRALDWRASAKSGVQKLTQPVNRYFDCLSKAAGKVPSAFHLLKPTQIQQAVKKLAKFLRPIQGALYDMPNPKRLSMMVDRLIVARPPVESTISLNFKVFNEDTDIRTILFAGWLAWHSNRWDKKKKDSFLRLNMLCDRGVLQQNAVNHWVRHGGAWTTQHAGN